MNKTWYLRTGLLASLALACATLLGACSLWPKGPDASTAPVATSAPPPPAIAAPAPVVAEPAAVAVAQSPATPVALSPMSPAPASAPLVAEPVAKSMAASALVHGFYVNAGLYAVPGNASKAYSKLESAGLPVFTEVIATKDGQRTRVRVGPYATRAKADAAAKKIRALKLDAIVFKH